MNANDAARDLHARARRALVERHAGMLEEREQAWLDEHLGACDECRRVAAEIEDRAEVAGALGHLPTRLVSRWDTESPRLPGVVRELMLSHLRACEQCRNELRVAGHALPSEILEPAHVRRPVPEPSVWMKMVGALRRNWALAGTLAAAAAASLILVNTVGRAPMVGTPAPTPGSPPVAQGPGTPPDGGPSGRGAPGSAPKAAVMTLALAGGGDPSVATLPGITLDQVTVRGAGESDTTRALALTPDERVIRLDHPEAALLVEGDDNPLTVTITTPSGATVQFTGRTGDLRRDRPLILTLPGGIEPGTYTYAYVFGGGSPEAPIRGAIRIRLH